MTDSHQLTQFKAIQAQFEASEPEFRRMLPQHIPAHRFMRVSLVAVQTNPKLLLVPKGALFRALMQCAQDGLLPDGREAALVAYTVRGRDSKPPQTIVSYQPMIAGIRKKAWNSGELASWEAYLVHERDHFEIVLGSDPRIEHKPVLRDRGEIIAVYSVAKFKSGASSMDWMGLDEVDAIRRRSRAADDGPWVTDRGEMIKKTMLKRHSKALPLSAELDSLMRREDELYEPLLAPSPIELHAEDIPAEESAPRKRGRPKLSDFRKDSPSQAASSPHPADQREDDSHSGQQAPNDPPEQTARNGASLPEELDLANKAESAGYDAYFNGKQVFPVPKEFQTSQAVKDAWKDGYMRARQEDAGGDDHDTRSVE